MTTQREVREAFWREYSDYKSGGLPAEYRKNKRQNDYSVDIRVAFVEFVDSLVKNGEISSKLAERVIL